MLIFQGVLFDGCFCENLRVTIEKTNWAPHFSLVMHPDFPKISRVSWCFISVKVEGKKCIFFCVKKRSFPERPHHTLIGFGAMGVSQSATLSWFLRSKKRWKPAMHLSKIRCGTVFLAMNPGPGEKAERTLLKWTNLLQNFQNFGFFDWNCETHIAGKRTSCVFFVQRIFPQSIAYCACYVKQWMPSTWELWVGGVDWELQGWNRMGNLSQNSPVLKQNAMEIWCRKSMISWGRGFPQKPEKNILVWNHRALHVVFCVAKISIFNCLHSAFSLICRLCSKFARLARLEWQKNWMQLLADFWWRKLGVMGRL